MSDAMSNLVLSFLAGVTLGVVLVVRDLRRRIAALEQVVDDLDLDDGDDDDDPDGEPVPEPGPRPEFRSNRAGLTVAELRETGEIIRRGAGRIAA